MNLLLHTCCGPCFLGVWEDLGQKEIEVTNYFFNPNIYPEAEYKERLRSLKIAAKNRSAVIEGPYEPAKHDAAILGKESDFPGRCLGCYRLRMEETATYARENGYDAFSTTLLVSPYQQHDDLKKICEEVSNQTGITFYYSDWRPHFRTGQNMARELDIYRQKYCGCKYSLAERT